MPATKPTPAVARSLANATVVLTRPAGTARALARQARKRGATVLLLPGLGLRMRREPAVLEALRAADHDDWIFTSPAAVRACFALWPRLRFARSARVFTVGAGSARALARHGLSARIPDGGADSEALLAMPQLAAVRGRRIALIGAPGGRNLIAPALTRRGARVDALHVYERRPPRLDRRHFTALAQAREPWLTLLSSAEALTHLCALLPQPLLARWQAQPLVVASPRLAALARDHGFREPVVAASALGSDLLDAAADWLGRGARIGATS